MSEIKKTIVDIRKEVEHYFIKEKLSAREILMVLRELENDAMLVLMLGQLARKEDANKKVP